MEGFDRDGAVDLRRDTKYWVSRDRKNNDSPFARAPSKITE